MRWLTCAGPPASAPDPHRLVDRPEQVLTLAADVPGVDAAGTGRRGREVPRSPPSRRRSPARRSGPSRRPTHPRPSRRATERRIAVSSSSVGARRSEPHRLHADRAVTHQRGDVHRRSGGLRPFEVSTERPEGRDRDDPGRHPRGARTRPPGVRPWRHPAVAHHDGRDALAERGGHRGMDERSQVRMVVHVDEAGRDDQALPDDASAASPAGTARSRSTNAIRSSRIADGSSERRRPRTVDDGRAFDHEEVHDRIVATGAARPDRRVTRSAPCRRVSRRGGRP